MSEVAEADGVNGPSLKRKRADAGRSRTRRSKRKKKEKPPEVIQAREFKRQTELLNLKGFGYNPTRAEQKPAKRARPKSGAATKRAKLNPDTPKGRDALALAANDDDDGNVAKEAQSALKVKRRGRRGGGKKREQQLKDAWSATTNELDLLHRESTLEDDKSWTISEPVGGQYIRARPLFSADEKYLITATKSAVHVYSTSSSLLLHSFSQGIDGHITGYVLSRADPSILYVATSWGQLSKWNWLDGECSGIWNTQLNTSCITTATILQKDVVLMAHWYQSQWFLVSHHFEGTEQEGNARPKILLRRNDPIREIKVFANGQIILVASENSISVGTSASVLGDNSEDTHYVWKNYQSNEAIRSCDAKYTGVNEADTSKAPTGRLDIVFGGALGCIYVQEDILNFSGAQSKKNEQRQGTSSIKPRELHWHRAAVGTVAWSHDGNYIISGGTETVLVLWQLETGRKQFLPHLQSSIRTLSISPSGSSYAVNLADNSVMILSTAELEPTAYLAGLQSQVFEYISKPKSLRAAPLTVSSGTAVLDPLNPGRLLLATPTVSDDDSGTAQPKPYMQTFDISNARHLAKQALTRNNATNANTAPNGATLLEPDVTCVQVSCDGQWLATVDEWALPSSDIEDLVVDPDDEQAIVNTRREISLRFWSWSDVDQQWQLNSRVIAPHPCDHKKSSGRVVALQSHPTHPGFASIGEDASVRLWVHHQQSDEEARAVGEPLSWWAQKSEVCLERVVSSNFLQSSNLTSGALCYSNDGSTIAAHLQYDSQDQDQNVVHFIDADLGQLRESRAGLDVYSGPILALNFIERFLVCLGQYGVSVWDVTSFELVNYVPLELQQPGHFTPRMAVNMPTKTFAIASTTDDAETTVQIYGYDAPAPIFNTSLVYPVLHLLSAGGVDSSTLFSDTSNDFERRGYVILDASASIRTMKPVTIFRELPAVQDTAKADATVSSQSLVSEGNEDAMDQDDEPLDASVLAKQQRSTARMTQVPADKPVVRPEQLAAVFDRPGLGMARDMKSMFNEVIQLYALKA